MAASEERLFAPALFPLHGDVARLQVQQIAQLPRLHGHAARGMSREDSTMPDWLLGAA